MQTRRLWRVALIVFISLDISNNSINGIRTDSIPNNIFMGFGFNPDLAYAGERLDILNFFVWMKKLQEEFSTNWTVYDASGYYIVNRTPKKKIDRLGEKPSAEQILDALVSEQDRPKRKDIMRNCDLRSKYLKRAIAISGIDASYIDSRAVFREDGDYRIALDEALEYAEKLQKENPRLVARIIPPSPNPASRLYLPLEIAEALYLQQKFGIGGKFGPATEKFFDEAIFGLTREKEIAYQSIRCPVGPRKPGYLSDREVIWTRSLDCFIYRVLQSDSRYREFVAQYLEPFRRDGEPIEEVTRSAINLLTLEEGI